MNIQNIILGLVRTNPMTGYELKRIFDTSLSFFSGASFGSIYPILRKLEKQGMVRLRTELQDGKPNRKIYSITPQGEKTFIGGLNEKLIMSPYRNEFLVRLFFFSSVMTEDRIKIGEAYLLTVQEMYNNLKSLEAEEIEQADAYQTMCYRFGVRHLGYMVKNTKQLLHELKLHDSESLNKDGVYARRRGK